MIAFCAPTLVYLCDPQIGIDKLFSMDSFKLVLGNKEKVES